MPKERGVEPTFSISTTSSLLATSAAPAYRAAPFSSTSPPISFSTSSAYRWGFDSHNNDGQGTISFGGAIPPSELRSTNDQYASGTVTSTNVLLLSDGNSSGPRDQDPLPLFIDAIAPEVNRETVSVYLYNPNAFSLRADSYFLRAHYAAGFTDKDILIGNIPPATSSAFSIEPHFDRIELYTATSSGSVHRPPQLVDMWQCEGCSLPFFQKKCSTIAARYRFNRMPSTE